MAATASFRCISSNFFYNNSSAAESRSHPKSAFLRPPRTALSSLRRIIITDKSFKNTRSVHRPFVAALEDDQSEQLPSESPSLHEATIDIQLPRRSLLVQFTCNSCGKKTQRLVNRLAYERGTIFVQCSGCLQHHKLVDNLGLVVEYDLREEMDADLSADLE